MEEKKAAEATEDSPRDTSEKSGAEKATAASRARNRTVMLTPEMTGQVRALLTKKEAPAEESPKSALDQFLPPNSSWQKPSADPQFTTRPTGDPTEPKRSSKGTEELTREQVQSMLPPPESNNHNMEPTQPSIPAVGNQPPEAPTVFDPINSLVPPVGGGSSHTQVMRRSSAPQDRFAKVQANSWDQPAPVQMPSGETPIAHAAAPTAAPTAPVAPTAAPVQAPVSAPLPPQVPAAEAAGTRQPLTGKSKVVAFIISFDKDEFGEVYEIRSGRWLLTSRPTDHGDYILVNDDSISPLHAIIRATADGKLQILDQLSEHGTGVLHKGDKEELDITGGLEGVEHGDKIRFGKREFIVCVIPDLEEKPKKRGKNSKSAKDEKDQSEEND